MENIRFVYEFEDETGGIPNQKVDMGIGCESGVFRNDVCETFVKFLAAAGFSTSNLAKSFEE